MIDKKAAFANLVVKFGTLNLLDYKEIFTSAIMVDTNVRQYGSSLYRFLDPKISKLVDDDPLSVAIYGRFVKETEYSREQIMLDGKLVQDTERMSVALSAFFCIFLADHRMAYIPETRNAPPLDAFAVTLERFLRKAFSAQIEKDYRLGKEENPKFTRANAIAGRVSPTVHVVPLPARQSIEDFVARFEKINSISVALISRNSEMTRGIMQAVISAIEPTGADSAKLVATGGGEGLDLANTAVFVKDTAGSGYEDVTLRGVDHDGNKLKGGNEEFRLVVDVPDGLSDHELANDLFLRFSQLVSSGEIAKGNRTAEEIQKISDALSQIVRAAE